MKREGLDKDDQDRRRVTDFRCQCVCRGKQAFSDIIFNCI